ncbi:hypothetical protein [Clostridium felsineum]|uniref:hypothetical protein n=1 Tax=Clostridium felsineum TaxID=36839 RepID=UPI00098C8A55|nr:hypothetical protein [Clostridium felsineum]URZ18355.1 hypothetical protein CLFE_044250 [Clostridium felsineum DSM 794]
MEKIIEIKDIFELPKLGVVIIGNNDELKSLTPNEIRTLIGKRIFVCMKNGNYSTYNVTGVDIPISIVGKKCSINICIGNSINIFNIEIGSVVYNIKEDH